MARSRTDTLIAVIGGSFDPIHLGHAHAIEKVAAFLMPSRFFVVPTGQNPHKERAHAPALDRLEMVRRGLEDRPVEILDWEIKGDGPHYTLSTLEKIHAKVPGKLVLVMGDDAFADFPNWHQPENILRLASLLVLTRTEIPKDFVSKTLGKIMQTNNSSAVEVLRIDALPFSSTELRAKIAKAWKEDRLTQTPAGLAESVWSYIKEKRLYSVLKPGGNEHG